MRINCDGSLSYNLIKKSYLDGTVKLKQYNYSIDVNKSRGGKHNGTSSEEELLSYNTRYLKKVREEIIDLALNNPDWDYFITLTFDNADNSINCKNLIKWLDNQRHKNKKMKYLIVPEFQKNGRIHFHGLISGVNWSLQGAYNAKTGKPLYKNNKRIYNLLDFDLGFTTVSKVGNSIAVSKYISKYATKDLIQLKNKKRYWYSRNLLKPDKNYLYNKEELIDILDDYDFYARYGSECNCIEVATQLPIIDIMLTSICYPNNKLISINIIFIYTLYYIYSFKQISI